MGNNRIEWIDSARGIAILLVVVGHVVGGYTGKYSVPQYQRIIDFIVDAIYTFHMPLFFMISGYVFGLKNYDWSIEKYTIFVSNKARNLLIPYFLFSTLQILIKLPLQGKIASVLSWKNLFLTPIIPIDQFWFIYVLFFMFCLFGAMDWKLKHKSMPIVIVLYIIGRVFLLFGGDTINYWGTIPIKYFEYSIFFWMGCKLRRTEVGISKNTWFIVTLLFCATLIGNTYISLNSDVFIWQVVIATSGALSVIGCCQAFDMVAKCKLLQIMGSESMAIYIVHVLLCAVVRIALIKLGISDLLISIAFGIVVSILIPILMNKYWKKTKVPVN